MLFYMAFTNSIASKQVKYNDFREVKNETRHGVCLDATFAVSGGITGCHKKGNR